MRFLVIILLLITSPVVFSQGTYLEEYQAAVKARESGDLEAFLHHLKAADSLRPDHPVLLYKLAGAYSLNQHIPESLSSLERSLMLNAGFQVDSDPDFVNARASPGYKRVIALRDSLLQPVENSVVAFEIPENDFHAEGIACHDATGNFYVGSVHKQKIMRISPAGELYEFRRQAEDGLMSVMGLSVDQQSGRLWVTSVATKEMLGDMEVGASAVHAYDLGTGALSVVLTPGDNQSHWFGDIEVDSAGNAFITDSATNGIYKVSDGAMNLWCDASQVIGNIQGIALMGDQLIVSDYLSSLYLIDKVTAKIHPITNPFPELILKGTDGLIVHGKSVYAIANGIVPNRVVKLQVDPVQKIITSYNVIDRNHPAFGEPTLGTIVNDTLYYIGNSSWGAYREDGSLLADDLPPVKILKFPAD